MAKKIVFQTSVIGWDGLVMALDHIRQKLIFDDETTGNLGVQGEISLTFDPMNSTYSLRADIR